MKYVASTVIIGPRGELQITRGYTEIGGIRFYDDQVVIGARGEHTLSKGEVVLAPRKD
jgi:hypothetical protein